MAIRWLERRGPLEMHRFPSSDGHRAAEVHHLRLGSRGSVMASVRSAYAIID
jgi:hypothetical protein